MSSMPLTFSRVHCANWKSEYSNCGPLCQHQYPKLPSLLLKLTLGAAVRMMFLSQKERKCFLKSYIGRTGMFPLFHPPSPLPHGRE